MSVAPNPRDFAIVIGINDYADADYCLSSPVDDAKSIRQWLIDHAGGGLDEANCISLYGYDGPGGEHVTQLLIEDKLIEAKRFSRSLKDRDEQPRRLYYYFSGHGLSKRADEVLMCHALWDSDRPHANLNSDALDREYLNPCTWFDEIVIWMDCCRNKSITTRPGAFQVGCTLPRDDAHTQKAMLAFATLDGSYAYEALTEEDNNSIFTEALLSGLRYAGNSDNQVSWRSLAAYLEEYVPVIARAKGKVQRPQVYFPRLQQQQDPVFCPALTPTVTLSFNRSMGNVEIMDARFNSVVSHNLADGDLEHAFPAGKYLALGKDNGRVQFDVTGTEEVIHVGF